jgi:5'-deoxynucleotidase YfbR-like HD superfamily hydrolase
LYAKRIADIIGWKGDHGKLLWAALLHDLDEIVSGDIPKPVKAVLMKDAAAKASFHEWLNEQMAERFPWYQEETSAEIRMIVEFADALEAVVFLYEDQGFGNDTLEGVQTNMYKVATAIGKRFDAIFKCPGTAIKILKDTVELEANSNSMVVE